MDNNAAEQSIHGFCIGKKNWVMIDTVAETKSSAIIYRETFYTLFKLNLYSKIHNVSQIKMLSRHILQEHDNGRSNGRHHSINLHVWKYNLPGSNSTLPQFCNRKIFKMCAILYHIVLPDTMFLHFRKEFLIKLFRCNDITLIIKQKLRLSSLHNIPVKRKNRITQIY